MPDACLLAVLRGQAYQGKQRHWARLLEWLLQWEGDEITPEQLRQETGLTQAQFKEARKHPRVQQFFSDHLATSGSGKNTVYRRRADSPSVA